jgi:hypothetical protein
MRNPHEGLAELVGAHLTRRPAMQLQDIYKLLYQGVCGPEHLVTTPDEFAARLCLEWEVAPSADTEPLLESIRPDNGLARVNLRPYKALGGDVDTLIAACLEAAQCAWGTPDDLRQAWTALVGICKTESATTFPLDEVSAFSRWLEELAYPAVHHSERYQNLYRPAYRLVSPWQPIAQRLYV